MDNNELYNIMDWHNDILKYNINKNYDKVLDVIIASEIKKLIDDTRFLLYDVTIDNLEVIFDQCIRGNSPLIKEII